MEDYTLLDAAITRLSEGRNSTATLARMVQDQDHAAAPNRIVMAWQQANRDRNEARRSGNEYGGPKPEAFMLSFVQKLQNQVCWSVGSVKAAQVDEDLTNQIYGLDFRQDIHDQIGDTDHTKPENFEQIVDDTYNVLLMVQTYLGTQMDYIDNYDAIRYYAQQTQNEDGEWVDDLIADNWDEAQDCLSTARDRMDERKEAAQVQEIENIDFGAVATA